MFLSIAFVALTLTSRTETPKPFEFKDGDRIVWLGSTLVEREQRYGYWETALLAANADKKLTVRNLGWSGDDVFGTARCSFDHNNPAKGFERLVSLTLELKPTVIFIAYGTNESFGGKEGLPKFEKGLEKLLDALKPTNARIVLFSPLPFQKSAAIPEPKLMNEKLALYRDAIKAIADKRELPFVDLFEAIPVLVAPTSDNGMHLTELGYSLTAERFVKALGQPGKQYDEAKLGSLRQAVLIKNEQFFNKWRPQNETYLFGFRKHEQGKNAKEIVEFDPFIAKAEEEIEKARKSLK